MSNLARLSLAALFLFVAIPAVHAADLCVGVATCECGIRIVSWRISGQAGQKIRYDGERHVIPKSGMIEFVSSNRGDVIEVTTQDRVHTITLHRGTHSKVSCDQFAACRVVLPMETLP